MSVADVTGEDLVEGVHRQVAAPACGRPIPSAGSRWPRGVRSGAVLVDAVVASDVRMPFGGTRPSGYGRELAAAGIREFVDVRTRWVLDESTAAAPVSK